MISIIVPVYKVEAYLDKCISSIIAQTYKDIEIILVDDGSPDRCGAICDSYAAKESRIRVFHTENGGLSAARNVGIDNANGEYLGFVDSDDWIEPDMYQVLFDTLLENSADISACDLYCNYPDRQESEHRVSDAVYGQDDAIRALIDRSIANYAWNKLYKRELFSSIRFPNGRLYEDIATIYKLILKTERVASTSKPLYHYRKRGDSTTGNDRKYMKNLSDRFVSYKERYEYLTAMPQFRDRNTTYHMLYPIADTAGKLWRWVLTMPKEERNMPRLREIAAFIRKTFPVFGDNRWETWLRVSVFLARRAWWPNFFLSRIMTVVYSRLFFKNN